MTILPAYSLHQAVKSLLRKQVHDAAASPHLEYGVWDPECMELDRSGKSARMCMAVRLG